MKKTKTYNVFNKIRAALRDVYRYSPMRKEAIKKASIGKNPPIFNCPLCGHVWPIQMADVDHEPPLGPLTCWGVGPESVSQWGYQLFHGNVQVICKLCHKKKTASQRKKVSK